MSALMNGNLPRFASALLLAVLVNVLLFLLMQAIISKSDLSARSVRDLPMIDYVRTKDIDTEPQRERRPPPPKPQAPEPPKVQKLTTQAAAVTPVTPIPAMKLSPAPDISGPYLGEVGGPQWVNAGDLVALVRIPPEYPAHARMRRIQGYVDVEFTVDAEGRVRNPTVVGSNPPGVFDRAALNSIAHWRFEPKRHDGRAIEVIARQRIEFELSG
jgi:protein TonB